MRWMFAVTALAALTGCGPSPDALPTILTTVGQVRKLSPGEIKSGVPARIEAVLTYFDRVSNYCFAQDSSGGIRVNLAPGETAPAAGWRVRITGLVASGGPSPSIMEGRVTALAADVLPRPLSLPPSKFADPEYQYRLVRFRGAVRDFETERPGLATLEIIGETATILAKVPASNAVINEDWVDADVQVSGVLATSPGGSGDTRRRSGYMVWIPNVDAIELLRPAEPPAGLPIDKVRTLLTLDPSRSPHHRVRIRGTSIPLAGGLDVRDQTGQISVRMAQTALFPDTPSLDVAGFLDWEHGRAVLDQAVLVDHETIADSAHFRTPGFTLTSALQVHRLSLSAAQRAYPVRLSAVVTYFDPVDHLLFVQDPTDAIYVGLSGKEKPSLRAGDAVKVTGVTAAGFAPDIANGRVKILGHRGLPAPRRDGFGPASWGRDDCHWIELEGVVQHVAGDSASALLTLAWGPNSYKANVLASAESLASLLDSEVSIRGVCGALFNAKHQMLGIQMFVPGAEYIRVRGSPPPDPFSVTPTPIADLLRFSQSYDRGHRVRLRGTVISPEVSGSIWIRDSTGAVMIRDHEAAGLAPGDQVDVAGFPEIAGYSPALHGAIVKGLRAGAPPLPIPVTAQDALNGDFDGQLVEIEGTLIDRLQQPAEQVLVIKSGETSFNATLAAGGASRRWEPGSHLRLTGICSVEAQQSRDLIIPRAFRLLLRSPRDIAIVGHPPFLTVDRVWPVVAGIGALMIAALAWVRLLRRRVRAQTFALRAQTVQLQAAHHSAREALQKAREAESLDLDKRRILELIARDEPADVILDHIAESVAMHCEAVCAILVEGREEPRTCVVPAMPADWLEAFRRIDPSSVSVNPEFRALAQFSNDPAWATFIESQKNLRFHAFCAAPVIVEGAIAGVVAAFLRNGVSPGQAQNIRPSQLTLWANIAALALERRQLHDQLSYRAQHDGLTGLPNRSLLHEQMLSEIERASSRGGLLGVLFLDLDGFKQINDNHGHDAGDMVLKESARRLLEVVRRGDTVARVGGDEFVVLLPGLGDRENARQVANKIASALREPIHAHHQRYQISACIGMAFWPFDGEGPDALLRRADMAMYVEKKQRGYGSLSRSLPLDVPAHFRN